MKQPRRQSADEDRLTQGELELMKALAKAARALKLLTEAASANAVDAPAPGLLARIGLRATQPGRRLTRMEIAHMFDHIDEALQLMLSPHMQRFIDEVSDEKA